MAKIVLLYQGREGQTKKIMERVGRGLTHAGFQPRIYAVDHLPEGFSLDHFDGAVLGCSIRYGKHHKAFVEFIREHTSQLQTMPSYFFSVNLTARKANRKEPYNNRYLQKFLRSIAWRPRLVDVCAGALHYPRYNTLDRVMIQLIMRITGGPTDPTTSMEFTDWARVERFTKQIAQDLQTALPPPSALY